MFSRFSLPKILFMKNPAFLALFIGAVLFQQCSTKKSLVIAVADDASETELLAAKEVRRYMYLRTGEMMKISRFSEVAEPKIRFIKNDSLENEEFLLITKDNAGVNELEIIGGSAQTMLYGAYEFAEQIGVRFYLHGDVIPDTKVTFNIPELNIRKKPEFKFRGIQPFHDFPEGPDWWNEQDYKAVIGQLAKMKMNFIGFHTYPERRDFNGEGPQAEPLVWIGKEEDINDKGDVKAAYPALHFHTSDSTWGYSAMSTSEFSLGASKIFETDNFGADYMKNISLWPHTDEENLKLFNDVGSMFGNIFKYAKELGFTTCVGTETPLTIPQLMKDRYGITVETDEDIKALYRGIFTRISKTYPLDYYWLWTGESWTWEGVSDQEVAKTEKDIRLAYESLEELGTPFQLATCGWVLGPPKDRTQFDRALSKDIAFSCINRALGYESLEPGFQNIQGRSKWAIPWMEDDPDMISAQLWAGRLRKDAYDAYSYGCDGLFGIHWRTRDIGPNISSLAKAAWDCGEWTNIDISQRDIPVEDFYTDWTKTEFGLADKKLTDIFVELDSKGSLQRPGYKGDAPLNAATWTKGPGALMVHEATQERAARYDFIPELEVYRSKISGAGNLERFDYWLNGFKFNKAIVETAMTWRQLDSLMILATHESDIDSKIKLVVESALPVRLDLVKKWTESISLLLAKMSTNGELGTLANLEMHNLKRLGYLNGWDEQIEKISGKPLPSEAILQKNYPGNDKLIVTANPSALRKEDVFQLRVRVLSNEEQLTGKLYWKTLGAKEFEEIPLKHLARDVFEVTSQVAVFGNDFEYYVEVRAGEKSLVYPATAGNINLSVVIF